MTRSLRTLVVATTLLAGAPAEAQFFELVSSEHVISEGQGGFAGDLDLADQLGVALAWLGDLDGDGHGDLAAGAWLDDDGGQNRGAVWILFLDGDGLVAGEQKISDLAGGFTATFSGRDHFGAAIASLGDLDGDGRREIAVGAPAHGVQPEGPGAVFILSLDADGTVQGHVELSPGSGGFTGPLPEDADFGASVANIGDLDGDGVADLAVGAIAQFGGPTPPAVWILLLETDGTVKSEIELSAAAGTLPFAPGPDSTFGTAVCAIGDLDGDGVAELAVGDESEDAVYVLFMTAAGTVREHRRITDGEGGFLDEAGLFNTFGTATASAGDRDGDGVPDLWVGARFTLDAQLQSTGAAWLLLLRSDGTVRRQFRIDEIFGGFGGDLVSVENFGRAIANLGADYDGDGATDLAVGASGGTAGSNTLGRIWLINLRPVPACIGDVTGDGAVDVDDLNAVILGWACAGPPGRCPADATGDGAVDVEDLVTVITSWGPCP